MSKGFTLIELLVVTGIIILLSVLVLPNYRAGQKNLALQRSASQLAQDIRRAQEMAMAAKECPSGTICAGQIPAGGYGIYLDTSKSETSYYLYADDDNDKYYDTGEEIEEIPLEEGVKISDISSNPPSGVQRIAINFKPPDPEVTLKWSSGAGNEASTTTITLSIDSMTKTLRVNRVGLVEIQ